MNVRPSEAMAAAAAVTVEATTKRDLQLAVVWLCSHAVATGAIVDSLFLTSRYSQAGGEENTKYPTFAKIILYDLLE